MVKKATREPYEAPDFTIDVMEADSIICTSWTDGNIPDGNFNDFGTF